MLAAACKANVDECVSKVSNPMSVRAVKLNYFVLHLLEYILSVLKLKGVVFVPVPTDLVKVGAIIVAQVILLEEVTRLLLKDCEVHQVATWGGASSLSLMRRRLPTRSATVPS